MQQILKDVIIQSKVQENNKLKWTAQTKPLKNLDKIVEEAFEWRK